jgi:hypothetical protein
MAPAAPVPEPERGISGFLGKFTESTDILEANRSLVESEQLPTYTRASIYRRFGETAQKQGGRDGKLLIDAGADVNARSEPKATPLHEAAVFNSVAIAEFLLSKGADPDARDRDNKTPLDWLGEMGVGRGPPEDKNPGAMKELFEKYRQQKKP